MSRLISRKRIENLPAPIALALAILLVLLIGLIDLVTGADLSMSIFYLAPIFLATWFLGARQGFLSALVSALVWMSADLLARDGYSQPWIPYWNTLVRLGFFLLMVYLLTQLKERERRRRMLERIFFHDILNVATGLRGYAELLQSYEIDDPREIYAEIFDAADQVITEIEGQRALTAAEADDLQPTLEQIHSGMLLARVIELYRHHGVAQGKKLELAPDSAQVYLESDESLLVRILGNMVKNALEACEPGETVTAGCRRNDLSVEFWVHNPQVIPRANQARIFHPSFSTKALDRGLGTYSMKMLTELLQGEVSFTSSEGQGTVFRARYPLAVAVTAPDRP